MKRYSVVVAIGSRLKTSVMDADTDWLTEIDERHTRALMSDWYKNSLQRSAGVILSEYVAEEIAEEIERLEALEYDSIDECSDAWGCGLTVASKVYAYNELVRGFGLVRILPELWIEVFMYDHCEIFRDDEAYKSLIGFSGRVCEYTMLNGSKWGGHGKYMREYADNNQVALETQELKDEIRREIENEAMCMDMFDDEHLDRIRKRSRDDE